MIPNPFRTQATTVRLGRHELAATLRRLAREASMPRTPSQRVTPARAQAGQARPDLEALAQRLADPRPVDERGVALTRRIVTDGSGPLYWRGSSDDLRIRVREAIAALEPGIAAATAPGA